MNKLVICNLVQLPSFAPSPCQHSSSWLFGIFSDYFCLPQNLLLSCTTFGSTSTWATSLSRSDNNNFYSFLCPFSYLLCSWDTTLPCKKSILPETMQCTTLMLQHQHQPLLVLIFFWNNWDYFILNRVLCWFLPDMGLLLWISTTHKYFRWKDTKPSHKQYFWITSVDLCWLYL